MAHRAVESKPQYTYFAQDNLQSSLAPSPKLVTDQCLLGHLLGESKALLAL